MGGRSERRVRPGGVPALVVGASAALLLLGLVVDADARVLVRAAMFAVAAAGGLATLQGAARAREVAEYWLLALCCTAFATANLLRAVDAPVAWAEAANNAAAVLLLVASIVFVRHVRRGRWPEIVLDGLLTGVVAAVAIRESMTALGGDGLVDTTASAILVVVLVSISTWGRALIGTRSVALRWFAVAAGLATVANALVVVGGLGPARPLGVDLWTLGSNLALACALTRSDLTAGRAVDVVPGRMGVSRVTLMALALAAAPAAVWARTATGTPPDAVLTGSLVALAALWAARFSVVLNQRHDHQQLLDAQLQTDPLTGIASRRRVVDVLDDRLARRSEGAVLFIDLDGFKAVNDQHGHATGDVLLSAVADRFGEVVAEDDLLARLSGDEFAVVTDRDPHLLRQHLAQSLIEPILLPGGAAVHIGASIGVAAITPADAGATTVLDRADRDMYAEKRRGGDRRGGRDRRDGHVAAGQQAGAWVRTG